MRRPSVVLALSTALIAATTAQRCDDPPPTEETVPDSRPIEVVLASITPGWLEIPGVVGTGQGLCDGTPCIVVYATARTPEIDARIPVRVEGHPVRVEITGPIEPLSGAPAAESPNRE